jgi:hypothetical protein
VNENHAKYSTEMKTTGLLIGLLDFLIIEFLVSATN